MSDKSGGGSIGLIGCILAVVLSWIANKSVLWCILHFFFSWLYCIYWALTKTGVYGWLQSIMI